MLIERKVIERFYRDRRRIYDDDQLGRCAAIFECEIVDRTYLTEDYGFCHQARRFGFHILCDPSIIVNHYGQGVWSH